MTSEVQIRVLGFKNNLANFGKEKYIFLDVDNDQTNLLLDLSVIENQDLGANYGIGSQQFTLPSTKTNDEFFGHAAEAGSDAGGMQFTKIFDADIMVDGAVVARGKLYFNSVVNNEETIQYKCSFTDATPALSQVLKDVALADLDWTDYDVGLTYNNITASWEDSGPFPLDGAVKFPNVFQGYIESDDFLYEYNYIPEQGTISFFDNPLPIDNFPYAIRIRNVIDKIFEETNLQYSSSFLTSDTIGNSDKTFDDIYMLTNPSTGKGVIDLVPAMFQSENDSGFWSHSGGPGNRYKDLSPYTNEVVDTTNFWDGSVYTAKADGQHNFSVSIDFDNANNVVGPLQILSYYRFRIRKTLSPALGGGSSIVYDVPFGYLSQTFQQSFTLNLNQGDELEFLMYNSYSDWEAQTSYLITANVEMALQIEPTAPLANVLFIDLQFGDLTCLDFLKGIQHMFNLVIWSDQDNSNLLYIEPYNTFLDSGTTRDWSDKVDNLAGRELFHPSQEADQKVIFDYKPDNADKADVWVRENYSDEGYGRGHRIYISDSDYGANKVNMLESPYFAGTTMKPLDGNPSNYEQYNITIPHIRGDENGGEVPIAFEPRILFNNGIKILSGSDGLDNPYFIYDYTDNSTNSEARYLQMSPYSDMRESVDNRIYLGWRNNDYWQPANTIVEYQVSNGLDNLFDTYYANMFNNIYRNPARKLVCNVEFEPSDLLRFKINDEILIDGQAYYINKISSFDLMRPSSTKVELIKKLNPINKQVFLIGNNNETFPNNPSNGDGTIPTGLDGDEFTFENDPADPFGFEVVPVSVGGTTLNISASQGYQSEQLGIRIGSGSKKLYNDNNRGRDSYVTIGGGRLYNDGNNNQINSSGATLQVVGRNNIVEADVIDTILVGDNNALVNGTKNAIVVGDGSKSPFETQNSIVLQNEDAFVNENNGLYDSVFLQSRHMELFTSESANDTRLLSLFSESGSIQSAQPYTNNVFIDIANISGSMRRTGGTTFDFGHVIGIGNKQTDIAYHGRNSGGNPVPTYIANDRCQFGVSGFGDANIMIGNSECEISASGGVGTGKIVLGRRQTDLDMADYGSVTNYINFIGDGDVNNSNADYSAAGTFQGTNVLGDTHHLGESYYSVKELTLGDSSTTTLTGKENYVIVTRLGSTSTTLRLPALVGTGLVTGRVLTIKGDASVTGTVTVIIDGNGNTIDGASTITLNANYEYAKLLWTGAEWLVVGKGY